MANKIYRRELPVIEIMIAKTLAADSRRETLIAVVKKAYNEASPLWIGPKADGPECPRSPWIRRIGHLRSGSNLATRLGL